jgi:hypothetical protein
MTISCLVTTTLCAISFDFSIFCRGCIIITAKQGILLAIIVSTFSIPFGINGSAEFFWRVQAAVGNRTTAAQQRNSLMVDGLAMAANRSNNGESNV